MRMMFSILDTGVREVILCDTIFLAIGYKGVPIQGIPFEFQSGIIPNVMGRVVEEKNRVNENFGRLYVNGWIKRGPSGIIGTNRSFQLLYLRVTLFT